MEVSIPLHCLAALLPLLSNVSMMIIFCRVPMLHTPSFVLLSSQAAVDIVLALVWNFTFELIDSSQALDNRLIYPGSGACTAIGIIWQTAVSMSTLLQATIASDRYLFIVHPFKYQKFITSSRAAGCCFAIFAISISLPNFIFASEAPYQLEGPTKTCIQSEIWPILYLTIVFLPSVSLAAFSSQRIWTLYSRMLQQIELMQECTPTPIACLDHLRSPSCGTVLTKNQPCLDARARENLSMELQGRRRTTLKHIIQSIIMRRRVLKKMKAKPQIYSSKNDLNTAAPIVMITECEKGDRASGVTPRVTLPYLQNKIEDLHHGHGLTPVDTPIYTIHTPLPFSTNSIERTSSPWSSCSSPGPISSISTAEKSPSHLSHNPQQSRQASVTSEDSSKSFPSSVYSDSSSGHHLV
ncbi:hypothetical protein RRG08_031785 [Elysia crispata]|uniref:G-protein coupled receptors family 1 profile domain-containing protein n=1 Tax=Elysia crispata TaxID=231223 RepID=A0AAE0Y630_9GAST|nr:hypothetical protein RRG08_031785 [Elysia crispata]